MSYILVAEDSRLSRKMILKALAPFEQTILEAKNGKEAFSLFQEHESEICCIISDNLMPEMSGVELLAAIRETNKTMPVIMASADIQQTTRTECDRLGIVTFLNKPVQPEELQGFVTPLLPEHVEV